MGDFTDAVEGFDFGDGVARSWKTAAPSGAVAWQGRVAGVVVEKLRAVRPLTGHELPFLKQHQPGPDQDDAAERDAVPGDFLEARAIGESVSDIFRDAVGYRRDHEERKWRDWRRRA